MPTPPPQDWSNPSSRLGVHTVKYPLAKKGGEMGILPALMARKSYGSRTHYWIYYLVRGARRPFGGVRVPHGSSDAVQ